MAVPDQLRYAKTPATGAEAGNKSIVDSNLKVEDVFYIPVGTTNTLNGGKDRDGAIKLTDGKFVSYANGVWTEYLVESNGLKEVGELVLSGNELTVTAPIKWRINSVNYQKLTDSVFTINDATEGFNRIDLVYAKTDNTLAIAQGVETEGIAVEPTLPINTIRVAPVYIDGNIIGQPSADLTNYYTKGQINALLASSIRQTPITAFGNYTLTWDAVKKITYGNYAKGFSVWIDGSLETVPISFTTGADGKPNAYNFILPEIETLIFIL